mmetsp:Transcript_670/g.733  ORF Transcript_670/g.733 Transcript_670/m.733 type:complete len:129 (+) Transcript_670:157-543(+)
MKQETKLDVSGIEIILRLHRALELVQIGIDKGICTVLSSPASSSIATTNKDNTTTTTTTTTTASIDDRNLNSISFHGIFHLFIIKRSIFLLTSTGSDSWVDLFTDGVFNATTIFNSILTTIETVRHLK